MKPKTKKKTRYIKPLKECQADQKRLENGYHFVLDKTRIPKTWVLVKDRN